MTNHIRRRRPPANPARDPTRARALLLGALLGLTLAAMPASAPAASHHRAPIGDRVERAIARAINHFRARNGLGPVRLDGRLALTARRHSLSMARGHYFAHDSSGGPWSRRVRSASHAGEVGEILAYLRRTSPRRQPAAVVSLWINSPPHRAVMLAPGFRRLGVGRARSGRTTFFTVDFASGR